MIAEVNEASLTAAAEIHAQAWRESHAGFCGEAFVKSHTAARQRAYLENEIKAGKRLYMLVHERPVGIVSIYEEHLIENLYVMPSEQRKGYGTELLRFAIEKCADTPRLWILNNNQRAYSLYAKHGFRFTGRKRALSGAISEVEMALLGFQGNGKEFPRSPVRVRSRRVYRCTLNR